jgi:hypothetical protein
MVLLKRQKAISRKGEMATNDSMSRHEALSILERCGISGANVYLMDLIPLIEMVWADGKVQPSEIAILDRFLRQHVKKINMICDDGVLDLKTARAFCTRFLYERPDPDFLCRLRRLIKPVHLLLFKGESLYNSIDALLAVCSDIAENAVMEFPQAAPGRLNTAEKSCLFEIRKTFWGFIGIAVSFDKAFNKTSPRSSG